VNKTRIKQTASGKSGSFCLEKEEKGMCVSEYVCRLIQEKMEDEYDLRVYEEAKRQYEADPVTYTAKELGL
uniref:DUF6290 family protein n=1 Tax=uncultured Dubosiella sp. TaxID=1937011 RepID=UPI00272A25FE